MDSSWMHKKTNHTKRFIAPDQSFRLDYDPSTGEWDEQLVTYTFWPEDASVVLTIPVDVDMVDWPAWHFDSMGKFSVKSAYKLAVQIRAEAGKGSIIISDCE